MASRADINAALGAEIQHQPVPRAGPVPKVAAPSKAARRPAPHRFKKPAVRGLRPAARWTYDESPALENGLSFRRWKKQTANSDSKPVDRFGRYNVKLDVPEYNDEIYAKHLTNPEWTKEETDSLFALYRECNGKWPVIIDHYSGSTERTMEDLKSRFYSISATILSINTPITSMTATDYGMYEMLNNFNAKQEASRKKLAEGHLYRRQNEVDEETVLLSELQRIMMNQATLDNEREELRRRLDHPIASNSYQYGTSQALTTFWQQLLAADRMKKNQRLRPTGNPTFDGMAGVASTSASRSSHAGLQDAARRNARESLPSAAAPQSGLSNELSKADLLRFGVVQSHEKLPSGVTFASDKLTKPRIAKSTVQTDKIAAILTHIGVPDLIALPTPPVVEQFESIMSKVHALIDLRKVAEKEEQELRVRSAEAAS
ncbi:swr1-complex protein 4 [Acrodontium crateriforme]|uniref:SWR1-complex protein 4 n=1 Tax=Acrodontium crateriforme TaxID=150365 RepID=A0AAQ3M5W2_9PEZI|nr:swr1-complex protein 4 [Acrodontium crateriforme]